VDCVAAGLELFRSGAGVFAVALPELIDIVDSAETSLKIQSKGGQQPFAVVRKQR
jgi:hypothetical protein